VAYLINKLPQPFLSYFFITIDMWIFIQNLLKLFNKPKEVEKICRAILDKDGNIKFESQVVKGSTLQQIIEDDKRYGVMKPRNGKYFTYKVMDWDGKWISNEKIVQGVTLAWNKVEKVVSLKFKEAILDEYADFKVYFRKVADDPLLSKNTLQYQYYPISNFNNPNRGVCVVNADYDWTRSGRSIPLHEYDPINYPKPVKGTVQTFDFDATYEHEGPGHGLGLPHSPNRNTKMYFNYSGMAESVFDEEFAETIARWRAKYNKRKMSARTLKRWKDWFKVAQDRD